MNYSKWLCQWHNLCLSNRISCIPNHCEAVSAGGIRLPFHLSSLETSSTVRGVWNQQLSRGLRNLSLIPALRTGGSNIQRRYHSGLWTSRCRSFRSWSELFLTAAFSPVGLFLHNHCMITGSETCQPSCVTGIQEQQRQLICLWRTYSTRLGLLSVFLKQASYIWPLETAPPANVMLFTSGLRMWYHHQMIHCTVCPVHERTAPVCCPCILFSTLIWKYYTIFRRLHIM